MPKMSIQKQVSSADLIAENTALKQQLNTLQQNGRVVKADSKFGRILDTAIPTHTTPTKKGMGVMLHLRGTSGRNYAVFIKNEQLQNVPFGKSCNVFEYKKDSKTASSAVIQIAIGIRKWTSLKPAQ